MREIAEKAGVSITTVSHVVNKTRHVSKDTREVILKVLEQENYQKTRFGNNRYRTRRSTNDMFVVGVVLANLRESFYLSTLKAIETAAEENDISILICDSEDDLHKEEKNIEFVFGQKVRGLVIAPIHSSPVPKTIANAKIPIVLLDRSYEDHQFVFVGIDNFRSAMAATKHLIERNRRSIAFIGYSESIYTVKQRLYGCQAAAMEAHLGTPPVLHLSAHSEDSFSLIRSFLCEHKIDGVLCDTCELCFETISVIDELGVRVPEDMEIITFDDDKWINYLKYPVSTINQPTGEIGNYAIETVAELIRNPHRMKNIKTDVHYNVEMIFRGSDPP